jgi:hypothetical protein
MKHQTLDSLYAHNLGYLLLEYTLDAIGQRDLRHRATTTCADELDLDDTIVGDINELNVSAIGLQGGTDHIEDFLYALPVHLRTPSLERPAFAGRAHHFKTWMVPQS